MPDTVTDRWIAGQVFGLLALALCVLAFASKRDERLFALLLVANVAFALQFSMFRSWVAAAIAALIVVRIYLVRRYKGHTGIMLGLLAATCVIAALTWSGPRDVWALAAGLIGTGGMFMYRGIGMRWLLAAAAFCWVVSNMLVGSVGGTLAESLILVTNAVTLVRLYRNAKTSLTG